jgi:hypothetical protein
LESRKWIFEAASDNTIRPPEENRIDLRLVRLLKNFTGLFKNQLGEEMAQ